MGSYVLHVTTQVLVMAIVISVILLFLGIGVLVLIHVCVVGRTLRRGLANNNAVNMVERGGFGSTSMSQDDIEKLPCFDFKAKEEGTSPARDCAVCLENFKDGEKCKLLPSCSHSFHAECVDLWLLRAPVCPICRAGADVINTSGSLSNIAETYPENVIARLQTVESGNAEMGLNQTVGSVDPTGNSFLEMQTREGGIENTEGQEIGTCNVMSGTAIDVEVRGS